MYDFYFSDLDHIFQKPDRVAIYQNRAAQSIDNCNGAPDMGAQVSYSGCLIENINSLSNNNYQNGLYQKNWNITYSQERLKKTSGGFPKLDLVSFTFHHTLGSLIDKNSLKKVIFFFLMIINEKEIEIHKIIYKKTWGTNSYSKGFFPAEVLINLFFN